MIGAAACPAATPDRRITSVPKASTSSNPHRRTRHDHRKETAEDYVEAVAAIHDAQGSCRVVDLARRFAVSHVTVTRTVARLRDEGLLVAEPYRPVSLTPAGKRLAAAARRRHEIVYRFLVAIGVDRQVAASDSEGIEHHVSPQTLRRFEAIAIQMVSQHGHVAPVLSARGALESHAKTQSRNEGSN
ncbi:MAG: manganese-binding transcriptional regulator MntR [Rhodopirellula sp.]|nr:manganese-binding transcriptional regulator MntR [Rhodopirellula sp.]